MEFDPRILKRLRFAKPPHAKSLHDLLAHQNEPWYHRVKTTKSRDLPRKLFSMLIHPLQPNWRIKNISDDLHNVNPFLYTLQNQYFAISQIHDFKPNSENSDVLEILEYLKNNPEIPLDVLSLYSEFQQLYYKKDIERAIKLLSNVQMCNNEHNSKK